MPVAEIIAIGTELLLGETQDTNTSRVARFLRNHGIDVYRTTIVGDNIERIAGAIHESLQRAQIVITTGGLGPTVDDATRQAAALAFKVETEFHPPLWEQILERFKRYGRQPTENNRRQAYLPRGAVGIPNPVGTAPAFYIERSEKLIICLPGVPREMETLLDAAALPLLKHKYEIHGVIKAHTLHASGVGESVIDELIADLETGSNPTVGLSAHAGQIDIRITVKAASAEEADHALTALSTEIQKRLGEHIYGANGDTLEGVITARLAQRGWKLVVIEWGLDGALAERLKRSPNRLAASDQTPDPEHPSELKAQVEALRVGCQAEVGLGIVLQPGLDQQTVHLFVSIEGVVDQSVHTFGGAPSLAASWASNIALDFLRRRLAHRLG